jgi:hypothetical protein
MRVQIRIVNPVRGGSACTSLKRALRFVHKGLAEWVNGDLRFLDGPMQKAIERSAELRLHGVRSGIGRIVPRLSPKGEGWSKSSAPFAPVTVRWSNFQLITNFAKK